MRAPRHKVTVSLDWAVLLPCDKAHGNPSLASRLTAVLLDCAWGRGWALTCAALS